LAAVGLLGFETAYPGMLSGGCSSGCLSGGTIRDVLEERVTASPDQPTLGVLFVHGIGWQRRGETLAAVGDALFEWLSEALGGSGMEPPRIELTDARSTTPGDPAAPAVARLVIRPLEAEGREEHWLLAESWWAETFITPGFSSLARWSLGIVPWTIGSHFGVRVRRVWSAHNWKAGPGIQIGWAWDLTLAAVSLIGSLVLSLVALLGLLILLVPALLPIPRVRDAVAAVQRKIAGSLGDSYVLLTRPIAAASIVGQVRRDLDWLAARCSLVAVVAHSQGAAVVHEAIRGRRRGNFALLFTFGSGLRKLDELRQVLGRGRRLRWAAGLTLAGLVVGGIGLLGSARPWLTGMPVESELSLASYGWTAVGLAVLVAGLWDLLSGTDQKELTARAARLAGAGIRWVDCHATADPVSNGPLFDKVPALEFPQSIEICNERSLGRDHTIYWLNKDEFVTLVVAALAAVTRWSPPDPAAAAARWARWSPPDPAADKAWGMIRRRRRWRVGELVAGRWIAFLSVAIAVAQKPAAWGRVLGWGLARGWAALRGFFDFAGTAPVPDAASGAVSASAAGKAAPVAADLWSTLGVLTLVLVAYWILRLLWGRWNAVDMAAGLSGHRTSYGWDIAVGMAVGAQVAVGVGIVTRSMDMISLAFTATVVLQGLVLGVMRHKTRSGGSAPAEAETQSRAALVVDFLWYLAQVVGIVIGFAWMGKWGVRGTQAALGLVLAADRVPGFWTTALLLAVAIAALFALGVVRGALRHGPR
jgi:hypothetical protein